MNKRLILTVAAGAAALAVASPAPQAPGATASPTTKSMTSGSTVSRSTASSATTGTTASLTSTSATQSSGAVADRILERHKRYNGNYASINWSGYGQAETTGSVKSVSGSFVVPTVKASPRGYASSWVGIDGLANQYLTQVGISEEAVNGHTYYYGWWEVITPTVVLPEQEFRFAVKPGQRVTASVSVANGYSTMTLFNNTTGKKASKRYAYKGPMASAEWIQEDVYVNGAVSAAPNWGQIAFIAAKRNGASPKFTYKQSIDIIDRYKVKETYTAKPNLKGDAFAVKWLAAGHWTSVN